MGPRTTAGFSSWRFMESVGKHEASDCKISEKHFLNSPCLISSVRGHRDSNLLNRMLKIERRCKLWNLSYFRGMIVDNGGERLSLLTSVTICYFISKLLCSSGLFRNIRCCCLLVGPQVVPASATSSLVSLAQFT
jgi:hypothetical protein